jgi:hypothetical protein
MSRRGRAQGGGWLAALRRALRLGAGGDDDDDDEEDEEEARRARKVLKGARRAAWRREGACGGLGKALGVMWVSGGRLRVLRLLGAVVGGAVARAAAVALLAMLVEHSALTPAFGFNAGAWVGRGE